MKTETAELCDALIGNGGLIQNIQQNFIYGRKQAISYQEQQ